MKSKHILINITEDQYNALMLIANKTSRTITNVSYLLLIESLEKNIINFVNHSNNDLKLATLKR